MSAALRVVFGLGCLLLGTGCAGSAILRTTSYWGEAINLCETGQTFAWAPLREGEAPPTRNESFDFVIRQAVERRMCRKGYHLAEPSQADLWVSYRLGLNVPQPRPGIEHIEEAGLAIDILEPQTRRIVWVGTAYVHVDYSTQPDERRARICAGVRRVLRHFPNRGRH